MKLLAHRARRRPPLPGERGRPTPVNLVSEKPLLVTRGKSREGPSDCVGLFLAQYFLVRPVRSRDLRDPMCVSGVTKSLSPQRPHKVACDDDGVGSERLVVETVTDGNESCQRLLDNVIDEVSVVDAARDDSPHKWSEIDDAVVVSFLGPLDGSHGCRRLHKPWYARATMQSYPLSCEPYVRRRARPPRLSTHRVRRERMRA